jgi:hypothetical protein
MKSHNNWVTKLIAAVKFLQFCCHYNNDSLFSGSNSVEHTHIFALGPGKMLTLYKTLRFKPEITLFFITR